MSIQLLSIQFHQPDPGAPTLALRRLINPNGFDGASKLVDVPEWKKGSSVQAGDSPVAICISRALHPPLSIAATIGRAPSDPEEIWIRAVDQAGGNLLGVVPPRLVQFAGTHKLPVALSTSGAPPLPSVTLHDDQWTWQWRPDANSAWTDLESTRHRVFVTLDDPRTPWSPDPEFAPWVEVLQVACEWASGSASVDDASSRITSRLYALGKRSAPPPRFRYQPCPTFTPSGDFDCALFLAALGGTPDTPTRVNCSDCASIVSTLANAVGANLVQTIIQLFLTTQPIKLIGRSDFVTKYFSIHEVAQGGTVPADAKIWDACLRIDKDRSPSTQPHASLQPAGMLFGTPGSRQYYWRLTGHSVSDNLDSRPITRQMNEARNRSVVRSARRPAQVGVLSKGKWFIWNFSDEARILAPWNLARSLFDDREQGLRMFDSTWWTLPEGRGALMRVQVQSMSSHAEALDLFEERRRACSETVPSLDIGDTGCGLPDLTHVSFVRGNLVLNVGVASALKEKVDAKARALDSFLTSTNTESRASSEETGHFSGLMPLSDADGQPLWYRAFSERGEIRLKGGKPEYTAVERGRQEVRLFRHDASGQVVASDHLF